jgi:hypothetical protein
VASAGNTWDFDGGNDEPSRCDRIKTVNHLPGLDLIRLPVFIRFGSGSDHDLGANHATNRRSNSSGAALIAPQ